MIPTDAAIGADVAHFEESALRDHVIAEINLARFIRGAAENLKTQGSELMNRLKKYQEAIGR